MTEGDTLLDAFVGAVVMTVLSPIPGSPVLGGAVAGYLYGPDTEAGLRVGALAGLIASIPLLVVAVLLTSLVAFLPIPLPNSVLTVFGIAIVAFLFLMILLYSVVLSAAGGYLGAMVRDA